MTHHKYEEYFWFLAITDSIDKKKNNKATLVHIEVLKLTYESWLLIDKTSFQTKRVYIHDDFHQTLKIYNCSIKFESDHIWKKNGTHHRKCESIFIANFCKYSYRLSHRLQSILEDLIPAHLCTQSILNWRLVFGVIILFQCLNLYAKMGYFYWKMAHENENSFPFLCGQTAVEYIFLLVIKQSSTHTSISNWFDRLNFRCESSIIQR